MPVPVHPGRVLRRELKARELSANRLALDLGVPSGHITDILNERRSISADTAFRLDRYFGNRPQFWLDLQSQYDLAVVARDRGTELNSASAREARRDAFPRGTSCARREMRDSLATPGGCGRGGATCT